MKELPLELSNNNRILFLLFEPDKKNIGFKLKCDLQLGKLHKPISLNVSGYTKVHKKGYLKI